MLSAPLNKTFLTLSLLDINVFTQYTKGAGPLVGYHLGKALWLLCLYMYTQIDFQSWAFTYACGIAPLRGPLSYFLFQPVLHD